VTTSPTALPQRPASHDAPPGEPQSNGHARRFVERDLRRADFRGGTPITMSDGQDWTFPRPVLVVTLTDEELGFDLESGLGRDFDAALTEMEESRSDREFFAKFARVVRMMLSVNYDLPPGVLGTLFRVPKEGFFDDEIVQAILGVTRGQDAPKAGDAG